MERIIRYYDGRFATDQLWCVFAVNYLQRNINQKSGGFFVEGFHKGVTSLSDLQEQIRSGNLSWVDKIAYCNLFCVSFGLLFDILLSNIRPRAVRLIC